MLGGSLQENVLTSLVHSDTLAPHIAISIKPSDFSIQVYRKIAAAALDYLQRYQKAAKTHIGDLLEQEIRRGPEGRFYTDVLHQMQQLAPSLNDDYVRASLDRFVDTQRLINAVNNASDLLHEGQLEQAREILRAPSLLLQKDSPGVWLRDSEQWLAFLREEEDDAEFSSGIETLDDRGVRPARGELMAMLAEAGKGKSWFLINCGKHNIIAHRRNVLHLTLENSLEVTLGRYTQSFLALTRDEAKHLDLPVFGETGDQRRLAVRGEIERVMQRGGPRLFEGVRELGKTEVERRLDPYRHRGQLLVKHFPTGVLTLGMLNAYLDTLAQTERFIPDLILIDYLTLMSLDSRQLRIAIGQLARNLRGLASLRNCAVVTALQANRQAAGKRWVSGHHVGEDWSVVGTCDTFLTYTQTQFERGKKVARVLVAKARNSADQWAAYVSQEYEIGQFCLDSCYHSQLKDKDQPGHDEPDE